MFPYFVACTLLILSSLLGLLLFLLRLLCFLGNPFFVFLEVRSAFQKNFLCLRILLEEFRSRILSSLSSLLGIVKSNSTVLCTLMSSCFKCSILCCNSLSESMFRYAKKSSKYLLYIFTVALSFVANSFN